MILGTQIPQLVSVVIEFELAISQSSIESDIKISRWLKKQYGI
jgi:hypothetical protein